jgi:peptide deformylase
MTAQRILTIPDDRLRQRSQEVVEFGDDLKSLVRDMIDTLEVSGGRGLAASQIGVHQRVVVVRTELEASTTTGETPPPMVLVNPVLVGRGGKRKWQESCLSVSAGFGNVERHEECEISYQDQEGVSHTLITSWPLSGVMQHEADHLDGVLYIDLVGNLERALILRKVAKLQKRDKRAAASRSRLQGARVKLVGSTGNRELSGPTAGSEVGSLGRGFKQVKM